MKNIILKVRKESIPTRNLQEEKNKVAKLAFELVKNEISKYSEIKDLEFGGSYAKGTWLPKKADIDLFVKFDLNTTEKQFIQISKKIGFDSMKKYNPYVRYSEHPYVEATINKTKVNVVPCYDVKVGEWKSSADRSPFHTKFMLESLTGEMKNEVRLLKNFLLGIEVYGSEIARQGFSGYVAEVLIFYYGSFQKVIESIAKLKKGEVIGKPLKNFDTSMIIIDPIDGNRNLGTAISPENVGKFVLGCRMFLRKPSINFFKHKKIKKQEKKVLSQVLVIKINFRKRSPDIIWGQIKKAASSLSTQMEIAGFKILRYMVNVREDNTAWILFLMHEKKISERFVREGPDFFLENDSNLFVKKNSSRSQIMWLGSNRKILSMQKRKYNDAKSFLQNLMRRDLNKSGIPRGLLDDVKRGFLIMDVNKKNKKFINETLSDLISTDEKIFSSN